MRPYRPLLLLAIIFVVFACHSSRTVEQAAAATTESVSLHHVQGSVITSQVTVPGSITMATGTPVFTPDTGSPAHMLITRTDYREADTTSTTAGYQSYNHTHWQRDNNVTPRRVFSYSVCLGFVLVSIFAVSLLLFLLRRRRIKVN